jgi:hypothetical protein
MIRFNNPEADYLDNPLDDFLDNPADMGGYDYADNPLGEYMDNPDGFGMRQFQQFGMAALGVGVGLIVATMTDRFIATMKPKDGTQAWGGAEAANAIAARPTAMRLGVQALGAVATVYGAYATRTRSPKASFLLGGVATGFGANLLLQLWNYFAAPALFKVKAGEESKLTMANRLYSFEQKSLQDAIAAQFKDWKTNTELAGAQAPGAGPTGLAPVGPSHLTLSGTPEQPRQLGAPNPISNWRPTAPMPSTLFQPAQVGGKVGDCGSCGHAWGCECDTCRMSRLPREPGAVPGGYVPGGVIPGTVVQPGHIIPGVIPGGTVVPGSGGGGVIPGTVVPGGFVPGGMNPMVPSGSYNPPGPIFAPVHGTPEQNGSPKKQQYSLDDFLAEPV